MALPTLLPLLSIHAVHYGRSPTYLTQTVQSVSASRPRCRLCSSSVSAMDYSLPRGCARSSASVRSRTLVLRRSGRTSTWNALPDNIRTVADPAKFRKLLKSHYFSATFNILLTFISSSHFDCCNAPMVEL